MSCWAIVAINTPLRRKRRLRGELDVAARDALARHMLEHVLATAGDAGSVERVLIVSPARVGLPGGYDVLHDGGADLSAAFGHARDAARGFGAREVVLLPADLPWLTREDVDALVEAGRRARVAIAPDRRGSGTNGLYLPTPLDFACRFGLRSRVRHVAEARRHGIEPAIVMRDGLAADLDTPADLKSLRGGAGARPYEAACTERCA